MKRGKLFQKPHNKQENNPLQILVISIIQDVTNISIKFIIGFEFTV